MTVLVSPFYMQGKYCPEEQNCLAKVRLSTEGPVAQLRRSRWSDGELQPGDCAARGPVASPQTAMQFSPQPWELAEQGPQL